MTDRAAGPAGRNLARTVWVVALGLLAAVPLLAGYTHWSWELAEILGWGGALVCLILCGCPVRPREAQPPVQLTLGRHELLGWIALTAAAAHVGCAVAADRTVLEYLWPTAPLYQLAGIAALLVLAVTATTSLAAVRRRLWKSHRNFQASHIVLGCLALVLLSAHVLATGRYAAGSARRVLYVAVAAGGLAILLRRRRGAPAGHGVLSVRSLAFGRHSTLVAACIVATTVILGTLIPGHASVTLREPLMRRDAAPPLNFDHGKHQAVNCLTCHHNYADGKGFDACIHCHRGPRPDLVVGVEARFHDFCLGCHRHPDARFERHGPVSGCAACHSADALANSRH